MTGTSRPSIPRTNRPSTSGTGKRPAIVPNQRRTTSPRSNSGQAKRPSITPGGRPSIKPSDLPNLPKTRTRPESGNFTRSLPATRPTDGRPSGKGDRSANLPGLGKRPGSGDITRSLPAIRSGNGRRSGKAEAPSILPGAGNRPDRSDIIRSLPATRSGNGRRSGKTDGPNILPGTGNRPDRSDVTKSLPAIRSGDGRRSVRGDRSDRLSRPVTGDRRDRPAKVIRSRPDRLASLNTRLSDRSFRSDGWRNRWDGHRHDRHRHWRNRYWYHDHWHRGFWPVYRPGFWVGFWWNRYPVLSLFGITNWSVNRCGWATGYYSYYNPYATPYVIDRSSYYYDYSQPIQIVESAPPADATLSAFDRAMEEFYQGQYQLALDSVNEALKELPNDAAVHEFRALVLFALGRYEESAATLYAVLSAGPGWDWETLNSLYPSVDIYTGQLRALEEYRNRNPMETAPRFVLAYHYMTTGYPENAASQLQRIVQLNPKDELSRTLLLSIDPEADVPKPEIAEPPKPTVPIQKAQLFGKWTAERDGDRFVMDLQENGDFTWTYTPSNGEKKTVGGVWAVDESSVIALEFGEDDVMLAQLNLTDGVLDFYMLGDTRGAEPLRFKLSE